MLELLMKEKTGEEMEELTYYYPKKGLTQTLLAGALALAMCVGLIYVGVIIGLQDYILGPATPFASLVVGSIGIVYFGYLFIQLVYRAVTDKPILEITQEGVRDNSSLLSSHILIPYASMRKVTIEHNLGSRVISIKLKDEEAVTQAVPLVKKITLLFRKHVLRIGLVDIEVHGQNREEYEKIVKCINQHRRRMNDIH